MDKATTITLRITDMSTAIDVKPGDAFKLCVGDSQVVTGRVGRVDCFRLENSPTRQIVDIYGRSRIVEAFDHAGEV